MSKKIAILVTHGFEESEMVSPKEHIEQQGWQADIVSLQSGTIKSWKDKNWGGEFKVDAVVADVSANDYDALLLPGGVINPDKLRMDEGAIAFVKEFFNQQKPVAAICHGPQTLINADVVDGREMTSFPSIKQDLINAGARWIDLEVVVDQGLVTSRTPEDLPAFNKKLVEEIKEGKRAGKHV